MKFADTSWWVAWALPDDARHPAALALLASLGRTEQVLTTNLVVGESWTFLRRQDSNPTAVAALEWLRRHEERVYSFVDATSFRVMRDRRLREAFAFDQDFAAAAFVEVLR